MTFDSSMRRAPFVPTPLPGNPYQILNASGVWNVLNYGADPTGVADSAPAFRAVLGSNRVIVIPGGTYLFKTTTTRGSTAFAFPCVQALGFSNFQILGYGATIKTDNAVASNNAFEFTNCTNFVVSGLTIDPSTFSGTNSGMSVLSCVAFCFSDITFTTNLLFDGFYGDWQVHGTYERITCLGGQAFDVAFLLHMTFNDIKGNGASGKTFFDHSPDPINAGYNNTGYSFTKSSDVVVTNCHGVGYDTGVVLSSGTDFTFANNTWENSLIAGYIIDYIVGDSVGTPVQRVSILGDTFYNTTSFGVKIDTTNISNSDFITDITINNCRFDTMAVGVGINLNNNMSNILLGPGNTFNNCTANIDPGIYPVLLPSYMSSLILSGTPDATLVATLDASKQLGLTIATGANATIGNGQGILTIATNMSSTSTSVVILAGGGVTSISTGANWTLNTTTPGAGDQSIAFDGSVYKIYNNTGGTVTYNVTTFRNG